MGKPRVKQWHELTRKQRRSARGFLRDDIRSIQDGSIPGRDDTWEREWIEVMRAAIKQLGEP